MTLEREITSIEPQEHDVVVTLACGHSFTWQEKWSFTAEQWADMLRKHWIGEKWPCQQCQDITAQGFTICEKCGHAWNAHRHWIKGKQMICEEAAPHHSTYCLCNECARDYYAMTGEW